MDAWLVALSDAPAVLVTVAIVEGSGPREAGAKMLVTAEGQFDTIGGGHLEMCAVDIGRSMLRQAAAGQGGHAAQAARAGRAAGGAPLAARLERFALGPSLGQCCGGVVHLAFEHIDAPLREVLAALAERRSEDWWRVSAIDGPASSALYDAQGVLVAGACGQALYAIARVGASPDAAPNAALGAGPAAAADVPTVPGPREWLPATLRERGTCIVRDADGQRWLIDACLAPRAHLLLFGAGHVGAALVKQLAQLPCTITWVDERDDMFPAQLPANVRIEATDTPEALVAAAPPGASFLVMTHSHALDQRLSEAILSRGDIGWFGLIGSATKRVQFTRRLRERGIPPDRIAAMACPIGLPGIRNKTPAAIAISVGAQLLMVWEAQQAAADVQSKLSQPAAPLPSALQRTH